MILSGIFLHYNPAGPWKENHEAQLAADYMWCIMLMMGAIPALATFYRRMKMSETARYTAIIEGSAKQPATDMTKVLEIQIDVEQEKLA
jgi:MFS transporter, PHS family, inorganic phosphate transporter